MTTWVAFLRAINTGNVRFATTLRSPERIRARLEQAYADDRGFEVPVVLLAPAEVRAIADALDEIGAGHYVWLLRHEPSAAVIERLEALGRPGERVVVRRRAAHLMIPTGFRGSSVTNTTIEKHAGLATNRNRTVIAAIAEKWS